MSPRRTMAMATSVTLMVRFISLLLVITLLTAVFREQGRSTSAIYYFDAFLFNTNLLGRLEGFPPWSRLIRLICIMVLRHECHFQSQLPIMYLDFSLDRKKIYQASCLWLRVSLYINVEDHNYDASGSHRYHMSTAVVNSSCDGRLSF